MNTGRTYTIDGVPMTTAQIAKGAEVGIARIRARLKAGERSLSALRAREQRTWVGKGHPWKTANHFMGIGR